MTDPVWLRAFQCPARFGISTTTLSRLAKAGLIGRTKIGRATFYAVDDIEALRTANATPRRQEPQRAPGVIEMLTEQRDWRETDLWRGAR